jgi:hypothetical protein
MIEPKTVVYMFVFLCVLAAGLTAVGAFMDHNGLFQVGADAFKTVVGAVVGALLASVKRR